jgi:hypothetical protein
VTSNCLNGSAKIPGENSWTRRHSELIVLGRALLKLPFILPVASRQEAPTEPAMTKKFISTNRMLLRSRKDFAEGSKRASYHFYSLAEQRVNGIAPAEHPFYRE